MPRGSRVLVLSTLSVAAAACGTVQRTGPSRAGGEEALSCSSPIPGANAVLVPGTLVLFGELHGTTEVPRFVVDLACQAASRGIVMDLGLELPGEEQLRIDSFLASGGTTQDEQALLEGQFWQRPLQDGRSSRAMADLLDRIRRLRRSGARIQVFLFDRAKPGRNRDADMAKNILEVYAQKQEDLVLVLTGNLHAKTEKVPMGSTELVPMGFELVKAGARVTSLASAHPPGTAWVCQGSGVESCGSHQMRGKARGDSRFIQLSESDAAGYNGIFYVPSLTASPPARASGSSAGPGSAIDKLSARSTPSARGEVVASDSVPAAVVARTVFAIPAR